MGDLKNKLPIVYKRYHPDRWLPTIFILLAITLGALHTWAAISAQSMNADGISYLDIGDAYMRGDWESAINSVWSPMYSWILGAVMNLLNPPMFWEFPVVHIVNFVIYLVALVCFDFFWRQLWRFLAIKKSEPGGEPFISFPKWAWFSLGYLLFIFTSLHLIEIWAVTPDMLMSAFVYLAAALIIQFRMGFTKWKNFILFGVILGLSYLAKAVMLPVSILFLAIGLFSVGIIRLAVPRIFASLLVFILISVPFIAVVSVSKGELTFGDAGTITYARYINRLKYPHWQGDPPGNGTPDHPSRKIFDSPPIYEFGSPVGGTYPISYDPSYWYEGLVVQINWQRQVDYLLFSAVYYFNLFLSQQGVLSFAVLLLYLMSRWSSFKLKEIPSRWGLSLIALAVFGFYGIVNVSGRYVGVFVLLFWSDLLVNVRLPDNSFSKKFVNLLCSLMIIFLLMNIFSLNLQGYRDLTGSGNLNLAEDVQVQTPSWPGEVAEELHQLGIKRGDKVAIIGYGFDSFWARLARVQIVAEMLGHEAEDFWFGDGSLQTEVLQAFASTGAEAVVAEHVPHYVSLNDWHQVGNSNYYIYLLE